MCTTNCHSSQEAQDAEYDLIVVGSGNGACAFLSECLKNADANHKVLVLEEGKTFFFNADITHQNNWSKSYATDNIFRLHNIKTENGRAIISGRANTMGGGGSINYTMIHESSTWLKEKMGRDEKYWDDCKKELNSKFHRPDPLDKLGDNPQTKFSCFIEDQAVDTFGYEKSNPKDMICNIPILSEDRGVKKLYRFPTQFNKFGQRTNSGVSIVDWSRLTLLCERQVVKLDLIYGLCTGVSVKNVVTGTKEKYRLKKGGRIVLCSGSQTPRLLMGTEGIVNNKIGKRVNDHICMPLGIYLVTDPEQFECIGSKNAYESIFAIFFVPKEKRVHETKNELVCIDFFTGDLLRLLHLAPSFFFCFLPLNFLKRIMGRFPILFVLLSNSGRVFLTILETLIYVPRGILNILSSRPFGQANFRINTALIKFTSTTEGYYTKKKNGEIILNFFKDDADLNIAEKSIEDSLPFLESLGEKPPLLIRFLFRLITKIPYSKSQVNRYVQNFSRNSLLSQQHLAGGCIFGDVLDKGDSNPSKTGNVIGTENIYVADLSAVPLPRISTQMTAYLIGHHVGKEFYSKAKAS
jgi:hypothetical protein